MMIKYLAAILIAFTSFCSSALSYEEIRDKLDTDEIYALYSQDKYLKSADTHFLSQGRLLMVKGKGLVLLQSQPFELATILKRDEMIEILDGDKEVISAKDNPAVFEITRHIMDILSFKDLENDRFSFELSGDEKNFTLVLTPKNEILRKIFTSITLKGTDRVETIEFLSANNDATAIVLDNKTKVSADVIADMRAYLE